ncbi:putative lipid kinase BmrU [Clostridia bacterium]|nr:putative lipid kinase BmrU [Clostridia bacterium]
MHDVMHLFIINPLSFRSTKDMDDIVLKLQTYFYNMKNSRFVLHKSRYPRDAINVIRRCRTSVPSGQLLRVYAVGGDGILFDCVNGAAGLTNTEITVMPFGMRNDFMMNFGVENIQVFRDINNFKSVKTFPADLIFSETLHMIGYCNIGMDAVFTKYMRIVDSALNKSAAMSKLIPTVNYFYKEFASLNNPNANRLYDITIDGEEITGHFAGINILNGMYTGTEKCVAPGALLDDGLLDVIIVKSQTTFGATSLMRRFYAGEHKHFPKQFIYRQAKSVKITSEEPFLVCQAGDVFSQKSISASVVPGAVTFAVPANAVLPQTVPFAEGVSENA